MEKIKKIGLILPIMALISVPFLALADETTPETVTVTSIGGFAGLLNKIIAWVQTFLFIIAVLFIILAAFNFLFAGGDAEKAGKAKTQIIYALVAIGIGLLAFGAKALVKTLLGGTV